MVLHPKQLDILKGIYQEKNQEQIQEELNLSKDIIEYYLQDLKRQEYITYKNEGIAWEIYNIRLTPKGKVAIKNPEYLIEPTTTPINHINISNLTNSAINVNSDSDHNTTNIIQNRNLDQNIEEIIKILNYLQQEMEKFPDEEKDNATIHLDNLKAEIEKPPEKRNSKRIKTYFTAFLGIALPLLDSVASPADFIKNVLDLGEKLNIEIPALNPLNENSQLTEENALMLADEIDTSAWKKLKSQDFLDRQAFMKLPIEKRQQILKEQAEATKNYYKEDTEGQEWRNLDLGDIYEYES